MLNLFNMTTNEQIINIANNLASNGQKPSVALIKSKLPTSVPLPTIIAVLKTWTHQPGKQQVKESEFKDKQTSHIDNGDIHQLITLALSPLHQEIAELKTKIDQLSQKINDTGID